MRTLRSKSRSISVCYALLATLYIGILGLLANAFWVGSLRQLWIDARAISQLSNLLTVLLMLVAVHVMLTVLTFRYYNRPRSWRLMILGVAVLLFAAACYRAYLTLVGHVEAHVMPQFLIPPDIALAFSYGICAWSLWRIHTTTNSGMNQ
jgi:hypothetical protein